jgi:hypothetical protein
MGLTDDEDDDENKEGEEGEEYKLPCCPTPQTSCEPTPERCVSYGADSRLSGRVSYEPNVSGVCCVVRVELSGVRRTSRLSGAYRHGFTYYDRTTLSLNRTGHRTYV